MFALVLASSLSKKSTAKTQEHTAQHLKLRVKTLHATVPGIPTHDMCAIKNQILSGRRKTRNEKVTEVPRASRQAAAQTHAERQSIGKTKQQPNRKRSSILDQRACTQICLRTPCRLYPGTNDVHEGGEASAPTKTHKSKKGDKMSYKDSGPPPPTQPGSMCSVLYHACSASYPHRRTHATI